MNLLILKENDLGENNTAVIQDIRLNHMHNVLAVKVGDTIKVGLLNGKVGLATITSCENHRIHLSLELNNEPPPPLPLTVILALPRPKMLRRILRNLAEFGIKECHLINSYKVEKSFWQSPVLNPETIDDYLLQGLTQAKDTILPKITLNKRFKPFIEDDLPSIIKGKESFIAHPYDAELTPAASKQERVVIIGPEGGFTDYEVDLIQQQGVTKIGMGPRIYRVENALTLLSTQLSQH